MNIDQLLPRVRQDILEMIFKSQSGHVGGSLSVVEILGAIYSIAKIDPAHPSWEDRDRIVLSKGHACPALYAFLAEMGFFSREDLWTLRQVDSHLQGHPDMRKTPGVDASTGSLGLGMSIALGFALAAKRRGSGNVYTVIGDGEAQEGIVWEAAMAAGKYKLDNFFVLMDHNGLQIDGKNEEVMPLGDIIGRFAASGWECDEVDGHDVGQIRGSLLRPGVGKPKFILCKTIKGKGVSFMENKAEWHGKIYDQEILARALQEVRS